MVAGDALILQRQELHREVHAVELAARNGQVARLLGAAREHHRVELGEQPVGSHGLARPVGHALAGPLGSDVDAEAEHDALGLHLLDAPVDQRLLHLEIGDAVAQQSADAVVLLEHRDVVAGARELLRAGEPRRAGADHGDLLASLVCRRQRLYPAFFPRLVDDRVLDRLDSDGVVDDA